MNLSELLDKYKHNPRLLQLADRLLFASLTPTLSKGEGEEKFIIGDPAKGIYYLNRRELDKIWISKTCLTIEVNDHFVKVENEKNIQLKWFLALLENH
jgi:ABC-type bacteriocin/lantibiotic exporter with double-glycine peptidase domain